MDAQNKVAEFVVSNYRNALIFNRYGIDFCSGGNETLDTACLKAQIDAQLVLSDLHFLEHGAKRLESVHEEVSISQLCDHIVVRHHRFLCQSICEILPLLNQLKSEQGEKDRLTIALHWTFHALVEELLPHLQQEEMSLFPYLKDLEHRRKVGALEQQTEACTSMESSIHLMEADHAMVLTYLKQLQKLSRGDRSPAQHGILYKVVLNLLRDFNQDLHTYLELENKRLFPSAQELLQANNLNPHA